MTDIKNKKELDLKQVSKVDYPLQSLDYEQKEASYDDDGVELPAGGWTSQMVLDSVAGIAEVNDFASNLQNLEREDYIDRGPRDLRKKIIRHDGRRLKTKNPKQRKKKRVVYDKTFGYEGEGPPTDNKNLLDTDLLPNMDLSEFDDIPELENGSDFSDIPDDDEKPSVKRHRWLPVVSGRVEGKWENKLSVANRAPPEEKHRKYEPKRVCYICGAVTHLSKDCPHKGNSGKRVPRVNGVKLTELKGSGGDVLRKITADPRPTLSVVGAPQATDPTEQYELYKRRLYTRAYGQLWTKVLNNLPDKQSVINSMFLMINQDKFEDLKINGRWTNIAREVPKIFTKSMADVIDDRFDTAIEIGERERSVLGAVRSGLSLTVPYIEHFIIEDVVGLINRYENIAPQSLMRHETWKIWIVWLFYVFLRLGFDVLIEMVFIWTTLCAFSSIYIFDQTQRLDYAIGYFGHRLVSPFSIIKYGRSQEYDLYAYFIITFALATYETWKRRQTFKYYLYRLIMHYILLNIPMPYSQIIHILYNFSLMIWTSLFDEGLGLTLDVIQNVNDVDDYCLSDKIVKKVDVSDKFKVKYGKQVCKKRFGYRRWFSIRGYVPIIHRQCCHNEKIGLEGRVGKDIPAYSIVDVVRKRWGGVLSLMPKILAIVRAVRKPVPFYDWVAKFPPKRRDDLIKTKNTMSYIPSVQASSFIKRELLLRNGDCLGYSIEKDCRIIQGCPLQMSVKCGPWIRKLAKHIQRGLSPSSFTRGALERGKQIVYTCGLSSEEIGDAYFKAISLISSYGHYVIIEDDQSRFDLHLGEGAFNFLNELYRELLPGHVTKLLRRTGKSRGRTCLGTKYVIPFTMQSGWPDTSCADTILNAVMKYSIHGFGKQWISIINGDDSITVMTSELFDELGGTQGLVTSYTSFGMEVEVKVRSDPLDVEFCSSRFLRNRGTYILMPKIGRLLSKIGCDHKLRNEDDSIAWFRGIGTLLKNYGRYDPLLCALGGRIHQLLGCGREIIEYSEYKSYVAGIYARDDVGVLEYYSHHYAFSSDNIKSCCAVLSSIKLGSIVNDGLIQLIAEVDFL